MQWEAQKRQKEFLECSADQALYGGSAGGGKSEVLLIFSILRRLHYANTTGLIIRRTLSELEGGGGLIQRSKELLTGTGAVWNERKHYWMFPNNSILQFGYCEREDDVRRYYGNEYADIGFDELTHFTKYQFDMLVTRCRVKEGICRPLIRCTSNPGNIGHLWVKKMFVDPKPNGGMWEIPIEGGRKIERAFIPAKLDDNKYLGDDYRTALMGLPEHIRNALLRGDWNVKEGQYFNEFNRDLHIVKPDMELLKDGGIKLCGIDWGYAAPFSAHWLHILPPPRKRVYVYREFYVNRLLDEEQAKRVLSLSEKENITEYFADPSCWSPRSDSGRSIEDVWSENGLVCSKGMRSRVPRWARLRYLLTEVDDYDKRPILQIFDTCENLCRTFPDMIYDKSNPEDLDSKLEDHALDSLSYATSSDHLAFLGKDPSLPHYAIRNPYDINAQIQEDVRRRQAAKNQSDGGMFGGGW